MAKKIVINDIKACHPDTKVSQTDMYYTRLANKIQNSLCNLLLMDDKSYEEIIHRGAIMLTNYFEDIVADSGVWRTFSNLCMDLYGHPVPLFHEDEEYYPDEPSMNAIRYLLWSAWTDVSDMFVYSDSNRLEHMAITAFAILDESFEEAPVNEQLAEDTDSFLQLATMGFNELRIVLKWVYNKCYLTSGEKNKILLDKHANEMRSLSEDGTIPLMPFDMALYYASTTCIFKYTTGHLALYPKDFLSSMMRTKGMKQQAEDVENIELMDVGTYKIGSIELPLNPSEKTIGIKRVKLTRTNGREIDINADELNYQGEWHLNGLLMP